MEIFINFPLIFSFCFKQQNDDNSTYHPLCYVFPIFRDWMLMQILAPSHNGVWANGAKFSRNLSLQLLAKIVKTWRKEPRWWDEVIELQSRASCVRRHLRVKMYSVDFYRHASTFSRQRKEKARTSVIHVGDILLLWSKAFIGLAQLFTSSHIIGN